MSVELLVLDGGEGGGGVGEACDGPQREHAGYKS